MKTLGNVIGTGALKVATPGAWIVMSNVCCIKPAGSMSITSADGTVLMPTCKLAIFWPSIPMATFGGTVIDSICCCCGVKFGAETALTPIVVGCVVLTVCKMDCCTRGR